MSLALALYLAVVIIVSTIQIDVLLVSGDDIAAKL